MYNLEPEGKKKTGCWVRLLQISLALGGLVFVAAICILVTDFSPSTGQARPAATVVITTRPKATPTPIATPTPNFDEMLAQAKKIPYKDLARNTEQYIGHYVLYEGEIVQVIEQTGGYILRVNITYHDYGYDDTILVVCNPCPTRPLDNDIVSILGQVDGRTSYETIFGANVTLPQITARSFFVKE